MTATLNLQDFLALHLSDAQRPALAKIMNDIADACKKIAIAIDSGALEGNMGSLANENIQGEVQKALDVISNEIFIESNQQSGFIAGMASEETETIIEISKHRRPYGEYLLLFDPLDGSSNVNVNISVGTIFSILKCTHAEPTLNDFLQSGSQQICAGYALYGTSTMLVFTTGNGTHGFTLDTESGQFFLTHANMRIPDDTQEFAINMSNYRFWQAPIQRYIDECLVGAEGEREKDFNMRWVASMVAEVHRILIRGGIFMYPIDEKIMKQGGKLSLMYEANPMSFIVEQAGGAASTGKVRVLDIHPGQLHQRVPVIMGSKNEVDRVVSYHKKSKK
ncbi:MAG TPA: class 1 fructose-bisphosphatase [Methylophilaceae bacterium]|nr:class 1 fructose-bisphosphatase [Methylophilaceae bacterium]